MYPEAYKEWIGIFNDNLLEIWQEERKELRKVTMLLTALQKELKDVQTNLEAELVNLKQQFKYKDNLEERRKSLSPKNRKKRSPKVINNENKIPNLEALLPVEHNCTSNESPDLFRNINLNISQPSAETPIIDVSISDEDITEIDNSPTIKRYRRYRRGKTSSPSAIENKIKKLKDTPPNKIKAECLVKANLFKTPVHKLVDDFSVIEGTPEAITIPKLQNTGSKIGSFSLIKPWTSSKRAANNTLTQMFCKLKKERQINTKPEFDIDSDETYCEGATEGSKMGVTDMLSYINNDKTTRDEKTFCPNQRENDMIDYEPGTDSSQEVDEFSKGAIFNETDIAMPNDKQKLIPLEPEPVVRGMARRQLRGWTCEQCKNFYGRMKLSPEELQKKMDECSRHRYKYNPLEDTPPGFWDLTIPPEKPA